MSAMNLPAVNPSPIPSQWVAPPSPSPAAGNAAGPGSFSQLLEAADARRQTEAPDASAAPGAQNKAQNGSTATRPPPPAQKAPTRDGSKTERAAGQADADNNTAVRRGAETEAEAKAAAEAQARADAEAASRLAEEDSLPPDAASLLASLGLMHRPDAAATPAEAGTARGRGGLGRQAQDAGVDATLSRAGSASAAAGPGGVWAADPKAGDSAGDRGAAGQAFAGLLAAAQGAEAATGSTAALAVAEQRLAPQAEARPVDASALGALLGTGAAPETSAAGSSAAHPAEARLGTTPGQAGFAEQLGAQLSTFVREGVQHARLQLHPLELGPVTVQIQLDGASAHLSFAAEHAQTRQALEQALPTLAGSLREAGLTLSGGGVFEQPRQPQGEGGRGDGDGSRGGQGGRGGSDEARQPAAPGPAARRRGVVDLVA